MTGEKEFDCVRMKHDIQKKLLEEEKGKTDYEIQEDRKRKIIKNSIFGHLVQKKYKDPLTST
ncbi:MAG TPA: hypothetical protein VKA68_14620 [bacterium]|nr:hypothetical protein [bacterium]